MPFGDPICGRIRYGLMYPGLPIVHPLLGDPALLSFLGFEEGSGNNTSDDFTWTMGNPARVSWVTGKVGYGLRYQYAKSGAYISTPYNIALCPSIFSISLWFRCTDSGSSCDRTIYRNFAWLASPTRYYGIITFLVASTGYLCVAIGDGTATLGSYLGSTDLRDNLWHHLVLTYDGTTATVFLDNVSKGTITKLIVYDMSVLIAIGGDTAANTFGGVIDEFYLFSKVLSASEITLLYEV